MYDINGIKCTSRDMSAACALVKKMIGQLGKDIFNAQHRILNHRALVVGEIDSFLHNFELKRNEVEVQALFQITETVGELKYDLSERCVALATSHLNEISKELTSALHNIKDLLEHIKVQKPPSEALNASRLQRETRRAQFCADLEHGYKRVGSSFEEKEEEIAELYSDLQLKLNIPK